MDSADLLLDSSSVYDTNSQISSIDEDELLLDPLFDLSHCSDFDNEAMLCSESVLPSNNARVKETPPVKIKIEKIDEPEVPVSSRVGEKNGTNSQAKVRPKRSYRSVTATASPKRSTVIKLNQPRKFRYVPDTLPNVEVPALGRKRKRPASTTCIYKDIEPTLLLEPKRRNTDTSHDITPTKQTRKIQMSRTYSSSNALKFGTTRVVKETQYTSLSEGSTFLPSPSPLMRLRDIPHSSESNGRRPFLSTPTQSPNKTPQKAPRSSETNESRTIFQSHSSPTQSQKTRSPKKVPRSPEGKARTLLPTPVSQWRLITSPAELSSQQVPRLIRLTSHSEALQIDVPSVSEEGSGESPGIGALGRATVFATRPGFSNRGNSSKFSLQHLGNKNPFSLDHL